MKRILLLVLILALPQAAVGDVIPTGYRDVHHGIVLEGLQRFPGFQFCLFPVGTSSDRENGKCLGSNSQGTTSASYYRNADSCLYAVPRELFVAEVFRVCEQRCRQEQGACLDRLGVHPENCIAQFMDCMAGVGADEQTAATCSQLDDACTREVESRGKSCFETAEACWDGCPEEEKQYFSQFPASCAIRQISTVPENDPVESVWVHFRVRDVDETRVDVEEVGLERRMPGRQLGTDEPPPSLPEFLAREYRLLLASGAGLLMLSLTWLWRRGRKRTGGNSRVAGEG